MFDARNIRQGWRAPHRNQDAVGGDFFVADFDGVGVFEDRTAFEQFDVRSGQKLFINAIQTVNFLVLIGNQCLPAKAGLAGQGPAIGRGIFEILGKMCAVNQKLFGDTPANDAGAANAAFLGDGDLGPIARRHTCRAHTARSGTNNKQVKIIVRHAEILIFDLFVTWRQM